MNLYEIPQYLTLTTLFCYVFINIYVFVSSLALQGVMMGTNLDQLEKKSSEGYNTYPRHQLWFMVYVMCREGFSSC